MSSSAVGCVDVPSGSVGCVFVQHSAIRRLCNCVRLRIMLELGQQYKTVINIQSTTVDLLICLLAPWAMSICNLAQYSLFL